MNTPLWTSQEIVDVTGGSCAGHFDVQAIEIDSRNVATKYLFVAMPGTAYDGHDFVIATLQAGAAGALVSHDFTAPDEFEARLIRVADVPQALKDMAIAARARMQGQVIAITGSAGKTGTKHALKTCLGRAGFTHASEKSFNNHVGVPLSLARMPKQAEFGVFELGMNAPGEIDKLAKIVRPHVAIVTSIGLAHRAAFSRDEDIADAKAEIFAHVLKGGAAIFPAGCDYASRLFAAAEAAGISNIVQTSIDDQAASVYAERIIEHVDCSCLTADILGRRLTFKVALPGRHWAENALNVLAAVQLVGGDLALSGVALAQLQPVGGRGTSQIINMDGTVFTLVDESYNANPLSMIASLEAFGLYTPATRRGRRVAVLGEMSELGDVALDAHLALAEHLHKAGVGQLFVVGEHMSALAKAVQPKIPAAAFATKSELLLALSHQIRPGDVVMVKGSNAAGMGEIVEGVKAQHGTSELDGRGLVSTAAE